MAKMGDIKINYPQPLSAKNKDSFAFPTIKDRLPVIVTKTIDYLHRKRNQLVEMGIVDEKDRKKAEEETKSVIGRIVKLRNELQTDKIIVELESNGKDIAVWNKYIKEYEQINAKEALWFDAPWLYVECYLYRRLREAFELSQYLKSFDPFQEQKQDALESSLDAMNILANYLEHLFTKINHFDRNQLENEFNKFIEISLWGNKCDLSISVGVQNSQLSDPLDNLKILRPNILVNETNQLWQYFQQKENNNKSNKIAVVLDNAGFELFTDLCLIEFLQESGILSGNSCVNFYVKEMPWFVSDVMKKDFNWTLEYLCENVKSNSLKTLGCKWKNYFRIGKWKIIENHFWTLPYDYSEMENVENDLYKELQASKLVLFKGDLNYRKLAGDLNWDFQVPLSHALRGFLPTTICSLRTIKADVVCGIHGDDVLEKIKNNILPKDWMTTGEYGLIQVVKK